MTSFLRGGVDARCVGLAACVPRHFPAFDPMPQPILSTVRTRVRLLLAFVIVYTVLAVATGAAVVAIMEASLRATAAARVTQVVEAGGFSLSPSVLERMQTLTGYRLALVTSDTDAPEDWLRIAHGDAVLAVDHRTAEHRALVRTVLIGTALALVVGVIVFAGVAWALARQFATPLERLAQAARRIGDGDLQAAVPIGGSGEVRALAADLDQMRLRLDDLDRQRRQAERLATLGLFTATIAHEVRNPLSAVRLTVQLLRRKIGDDPGIAIVEDELERLDLIIDELLAFSKGVTVRPETVALRPLAEHVVRLLQRQAEHAGVDLVVVGEADVHADPARLRQLLLNLVLNAIQVQHGDGHVAIHLCNDGLTVEDHGPGVDPALVATLFEPFVSGRPQGTGLGLHLAQAIAVAHGGRLRYERVDGRTRVHLEGLAMM